MAPGQFEALRPHRGLGMSVVVLLGLVLIVIGASVDQRGAPATPQSAAVLEPAPFVGSPAPDFDVVTPDGERIRLSDLRGQGVLINFWATWCGPCRAEMPTLQAIYDQQKARGFTIVGINLREPARPIQRFMQELGLTFPVALDPEGSVAARYQAINIPASFFVDRDGIIRARYLGPMSRQVMDASLEAILP